LAASARRHSAYESALPLAAGIASQPNQPGASWVASVSLSSTARTTFTIGTINFDRGTDLNVAGNRFVDERAGLYLIGATWNSGNIANQCSCVVNLQRNGNPIGATIIDRQSIGAGIDNVGDSYIHIMNLAAGDFIDATGQTSCTGTAITGEFHVLRLM